MDSRSKMSGGLALAAVLAVSTPTAVLAQQNQPPQADLSASVDAPAPAMTPGPELKGIISARSGDRMQVMSEDGTKTIVAINDATKITGSGGFLGLGRSHQPATSLLNGLPVTVKTMQTGGPDLLASAITFRNTDLKTASMIRTGTAQGFAEQTAATEALRGRMADIDEYNVKGTTNVYFDTGKAALNDQAKAELCNTATQADGMKNALILVVGYTDSTGPEDFNQELSEKRAAKVVDFLQQACHWKPYRMLTPTGMSEADPVADNTTADGKAQNRRVAVNILVSKGLDGM